MIRGTTPTFIFTIPDNATGGSAKVILKQNNIRKEKTSATNGGLTINGNRITMPLTVNDTMAFKAGQAVLMQVIINKNGNIMGCKPISVPVTEML